MPRLAIPVIDAQVKNAKPKVNIYCWRAAASTFDAVRQSGTPTSPTREQ